MRDVYQATITYRESGVLVPAEDVEITVCAAGSSVPVNIYQRREGAAVGNAIEAATNGGPNPFSTGPNGTVEFWVPAGVYDIHIRDTRAPERVSRRGFGSSSPPLQWNSSPSSPGSFPSTAIREDAGIKLGSLSPEVNRQLKEIGEVWSWWRPSSSVPLPTGSEICDGRQIADGNHDFPVAGPINLPDLRNKFTLGADPFKADGTGTIIGDGTAAPGAQHPNAPGIRGSGGAMRVTLAIAHMPAHNHGGATGTGTTGGTITDWMTQNSVHQHGPANADQPFVAFSSGTNLTPWGLTYRSPSYPQGTSSVNTDSRDINHRHVIPGLHVPALAIGSQGSGSAHDNQPSHYGLLKLMKVRRA